MAGVAVWSTLSPDLYPSRVRSPRLDAIEAGPDREERIRSAIAREYPWVEPLEADWYAVTWFASARPGEHVYLMANTLLGFPLTSPAIGAFEAVPGTSLAALTLRLPGDSRFGYQVARSQTVTPDTILDRAGWGTLTANATVDEFNPHTTPDVPSGRSSHLVLPGARPDPWPASAPDPCGRVDRHEFHSTALGRSLPVWSYVPDQVTPDTPLLVLLDGEVWNERVEVRWLLDDLIASGRIPPIAVVMPEGDTPETRMAEMTLNPAYLAFLQDELLPWAEEVTGCAPTSRRLIGGWSLGGLTAAYAALHIQQLRTVISLSGSFWWPLGTPLDRGAEALAQMLTVYDGPHTTWYIEVGRGEAIQLRENRHAAQVARARGDDVTFVDHGGVHDLVNARIGLAYGLLETLR